jgi:hypothetical protein
VLFVSLGLLGVCFRITIFIVGVTTVIRAISVIWVIWVISVISVVYGFSVSNTLRVTSAI